MKKIKEEQKNYYNNENVYLWFDNLKEYKETKKELDKMNIKYEEFKEEPIYKLFLNNIFGTKK